MITGDDIEDPRQQRRRSTDQPAPLKTLGQVVIGISIVTAIFSAGWSWRSVSIVEANQDQFVRKDVQQQQLNTLTYQLGELSRQVEEIRVELRAQRRKPVE